VVHGTGTYLRNAEEKLSFFFFLSFDLKYHQFFFYYVTQRFLNHNIGLKSGLDVR